MDKNLCFSLITWLKTFPSYENIVPSDLTNGVPLAHILHLIAPEHFSDHWVSRIRTDVSDNWRLKVSNLKKVYQGVIDFFYHTELPVQALQEFPFPDVNKIAENEDEVELGRLLQLILGCAINCAQKQKHIENIMKLEESIQTLIVNAIQDLMSSDGSLVNPEISGGASPSGVWLGPASFQPQVKTMMEQLETLSLAKDDLTKRCNELDLQVSVLTEEKKALKDEKEVLVEKIELLEAGEDIGGQSFRNKDLRKQVESLQDELFKIESSRDDYRSRMESFEKENKELTSRIDELQNLADESRTLKDEVDALRDMSERVAVFEGTVETYKKKLEELNDLKRQLKLLEEKNSEYMHQNMELEEEIKKSGTWRPQLELYKKQVAELHQKLSDEAKRTDRQIFENKKLNEKLEALAQEKERVMVERDVLKENVDELKCTITAFNSTETSSRAPTDLSDLDNLEIVSPEIREKLVRLQHENRLLKQKASDRSVESSSVLQSLLSDLQERHDKIVQENRELNQRIMSLESDIEDAKNTSGSMSTMQPSVTPKTNSDARKILELERKLGEKNDKITALEDDLRKNQSDMNAMEERYKRYLSKAKAVIKTLDPKHNPNISQDFSTMRSQIIDREKQIEKLEKESEKNKAIREVEDRLISTAFYNFGVQMHRQMINQRLAPLDSSQSSFLSRQRQVSSRRSMNNTGGSNQFFEY